MARERIPVRILHRIQRIDNDEAYFYYLLRVPQEFIPLFHFIKFYKCIRDIEIVVDIPDDIYEEYLEWLRRNGRVEYDASLLDKCRGNWKST